MKSPASLRLAWVDIVRAGGAFLVVLAHIVLYPQLMGAGPFWAQVFYYTATRVAVPLFFMVSGYLLLQKQEGLSDFFRKRALKVFIPFLVWSFVYLAWHGDFSEGNFSLAVILQSLARVLRGPREAHLWFFYALIGLYLLTPTLRVFTAHASDRDLLYFCGMWFFIVPVLSIVTQYTPIQVGFEFQFFTGYIGYYVLGHFLGRLALTSRRLAAAGVILFLSFVFTFFAIFLGRQGKNYDQFFESYLSIGVALMTSAVFLLVRASNNLVSPRVANWIVPFSNASLGIYLLHVLVFDLIDTYLSPRMPFLQTSSSLIVMPLVAIAGFAVCFFTIFIIQRTPLLKYAVP